MITLSNLDKTKTRGSRRVGRGYGSGAGAKSGRGTKRHQKAREKIKIWFEGGQNRMIKKFPLLRGKEKNKSVVTKPLALNLTQLDQMDSSKEIDIKVLIESGFVRSDKAKHGVKVLGTGELTHAITVKLPVSKTARAKIEKAGGKVV